MTFKIVLLLISFFNFPQIKATKYIEVEMEVTAYCGCEKCCGVNADGITASGHKLHQGDKIVAAPKTLRFGTRIFIPGYGLASVQDRGGAIKNNRLDVYFHTHQEALNWGRQKLIVVQFPEK